MISLDLARRQMALEGKKIFSRLWDWGLGLREDLHRNGFLFLETEKAEKMGFFLDPCRITMLFPKGGGRQFSALLETKGCQPEMEREGFLLAIVGPSQLKYPQGSFLKALLKSRSACKHIGKATGSLLSDEFPPTFFKTSPHFSLTPQEAMNAPKTSIPLENALGEICGEVVIQSPPGIPLLSPGEILTEEMLHFLLQKRNEAILFQGARDPALKRITIVRKT